MLAAEASIIGESPSSSSSASESAPSTTSTTPIINDERPEKSEGEILATVAAYEEKFKKRYTEEDEEYVKTLNTPLPPAPCVENWYSRPKRTFDWASKPQQGDRNRDDREQKGYQERDNERSNYQSQRGQGGRPYYAGMRTSNDELPREGNNRRPNQRGNNWQQNQRGNEDRRYHPYR